MTLPKFLIIGAMKAGTTTLYEDLLQIPALWLPPQKEPEDLIHPEVETAQGLRVYEQKFARCPSGAIAGDASTAYAKRPTYEGVAARAKRVLGADLRIIYLTRDPIRRIVSQYHHHWGLELEHRPMAQALREDESYLAYSRYDWQLEPWRAAFDPAQIMVVRFEDYMADRAATMQAICAFLDVPAALAEAPAVRNASEGKRIVRRGGLMARLAESRFYLFGIKPLLSSGLRDAIKALILPKARQMTETLDPETRAALETVLRQDALAGRYFQP